MYYSPSLPRLACYLRKNRTCFMQLKEQAIMRQGLSAMLIFSHVQSTLVTRTKSKLHTGGRTQAHVTDTGHRAPKRPLPPPPWSSWETSAISLTVDKYDNHSCYREGTRPPTLKERSVVLVGLCPMFLNQNNHHKAGARNPGTWEAEARGLTPAGGQPGLYKGDLIFSIAGAHGAC